MRTLIEQLRSGILPEVIEKIARSERIGTEQLVDKIITGRVVVPWNLRHKKLSPIAIGEGLKTKVNANIGTSGPCSDIDEELAKLAAALEAGADAVMDLSTGGDLDAVRGKVVATSTAPLGTVPVYQAALEAKERRGSVVNMTVDDLFDTIERQAEDGVDFMTLHAGITRKSIDSLKSTGRVTDVVSRGGALTVGWILHNESENPLYERYDRLLEIARRYDITLSLGDGMRPGCLADASDAPQIQELITLGELAQRAREASVQVMIEGPGHMPINQIEANVLLEKKICAGAPFYVLGPLVTDIAPGYDHITSAIGGAVAGCAGADFLCYVTPSEHLGLPSVEDVCEGVIASRIAAHAADIVKAIPGAADWDLEMAKARKALDWKRQAELAIDPRKAVRLHSERLEEGEEVCTMCGELCAMKLVSDYLGATRVEPC